MLGFGAIGTFPLGVSTPNAGAAPDGTAAYPDIPDVVVVPTPPTAAERAIATSRWLVRTALFDQFGHVEVQDLRLLIKRGIGDNATAPKIKFRVNRDNKGFGRWITKSLGLAGERFSTINIGPLGQGHVWQFEVACTDDCDIELQAIEAIVVRIGN